ncbi:Epoxyqueuosine reductase QueG (queuosine biosynthesis) [Sporobacter termitidis DSM 10068]|uniref:Epoxyqueuosine reductase QueG (Queuosine biosynthesis) n=1 Tax=Sporobacter termitidis DSM 10068 TaxID=1123282 RepID=A0A1M5YVF5_9FIRM|nr:epoxyqueuosine reductase [Sporobacter termitidis]SHI15830.1 Epoxyqueuosine reductase QueG (queuosine biosynthesis) [Sporobacter termitidis DSM 10068]
MKEEIRKLFKKLGADVCGIANIDRFGGAPAGFHPRDIYPECQSVAVFGVAIPRGLYEAGPRVIYNRFSAITKIELDRIAYNASLELERNYGGAAVPLPSDGPYEYWDAEKLEGRGLISMRHAAALAGLGAFGKSALLLNGKYGNTLNFGAVLLELDLPSDDDAESICLDGCRRCLESCPVGALDGTGANQKLCRPNTYFENARGFEITNCNSCRAVCPMRFGI